MRVLARVSIASPVQTEKIARRHMLECDSDLQGSRAPCWQLTALWSAAPPTIRPARAVACDKI